MKDIKNYIVFVLGADLLSDELRNTYTDEAYDLCCNFAVIFMQSKEYCDLRMGLYTAIEVWIEHNYPMIENEIRKISREDYL